MEQTGRIQSVDIPSVLAGNLNEVQLTTLARMARRCVAEQFNSEFGGGAPEYYNDYVQQHYIPTLESMLANPDPYLAQAAETDIPAPDADEYAYT